MQNNNDVRLNEAIIAGDMEAFELLFARSYSSLLGFVITLTQDVDQAKDIVQLAFIYVWNKRETLVLSSNLSNLLLVAAKNIFIDQYRSNQSRARLYAQLAMESIEEYMDNDDFRNEQIQKLRKVIAALPAKCQQILIMTKFNGFTRKEVAEYLNISVKTVEAQIRLAYKKIKEEFDADKTSIILYLLPQVLPSITGESSNKDS
ncbi:RNA polymerase sigma factor [Zhouia sp. PK063]|uniref:RNA polymerase sigma factor n=1 Tax=Zhouia sp. PK063 TaxID=3373602 RepID=UPI0037B12CD8